MTSLRLRARVAWTAPVVLVLPFLMGADGKGCQAGGDIPIGGGEDSGLVEEGGSRADGSSGCTPAACAALPAPALAKICPDGTTLTASLCEEQLDGQCAWGFPACPADACVALPCVPCPYGSLGIGKDANGCDTCPICLPPDAGQATDACAKTAPICFLPNCMYGVIPQKDANGCDTCAICAPPPDAGSCQCGPPPPVAACPDGSARVVSCEPLATGSCSWVVGPCPAPRDGGGTACAGDVDCPAGKVCGFLESGGCGAAGSCFPAPTVICNAYGPGCACDGSEVNTICNGLPSGYARKPLKHTGACVDGG
jgi:hypothetical protein